MGENDKLEGIDAIIVSCSTGRRAFCAHRALHYPGGDTLVSIADRFGVSLSQLRRWNKLGATGIKVDAGRRLHVAEPTSSRSASRRRHGASATNSNRSREVASTSEPTHESTSSAKTSKGTPHSAKTGHTTKKSGSSSAHKSQPHKQTVAPHLFLAKAKVNGSPTTYLCFDSFYMQAVDTMAPHADMNIRTANSIFICAAAVRWRQSDG